MFNKLKLKCGVVAAVALVLTILTQQGTLAYYSTVGKATNVITSGNISLAIHETTDTGAEFPKDGVYVVPGSVVSKQVSVENVCEHPFYLRVKMVYGANSASLNPSECFKLNINTEKWLYYDGWYYYCVVLNPGQTTEYVFSQVEIIGSTINSNNIGDTLSLTVKAQAVQSENNPLENDNIFSAQGWPLEMEAN